MRNKKLQAMTECAIFVAMAMGLSYLKIPIGLEFGGFGGSIDLVMIPLIVASCRWGLGWGLGASLVFGTLKYFFAGGRAVNWESMLLDYSIAYMFVGFSGLLKRKPDQMWLAALIGCAARFLVHFISGITIYAVKGGGTLEAQVNNTAVFSLHAHNACVYSLIYNAAYMLPNTILAVILCLILGKALRKQLLK